MPQTCSICKSKRLAEINRELITGTSCRDIARRYRLSKTAVNRHKQAHLPASLQLAREHENVLSAEHLLAEMSELKDRLWRGLEQAETARNPAAFVSFAREFRQCLESYFHISEGIADKARANGKVEIHVVYDTPDGKPWGPPAAYASSCPHCDGREHRSTLGPDETEEGGSGQRTRRAAGGSQSGSSLCDG